MTQVLAKQVGATVSKAVRPSDRKEGDSVMAKVRVRETQILSKATHDHSKKTGLRVGAFL
ncbi:hypothetical protein NUH87_28545 [Pseudomonas batumici]|uniref:hypothetical protein n=1 Tax=Pseudomonas batumici TaxID=226910 RepID=UPI0030D21971